MRYSILYTVITHAHTPTHTRALIYHMCPCCLLTLSTLYTLTNFLYGGRERERQTDRLIESERQGGQEPLRDRQTDRLIESERQGGQEPLRDRQTD